MFRAELCAGVSVNTSGFLAQYMKSSKNESRGGGLGVAFASMPKVCSQFRYPRQRGKPSLIVGSRSKTPGYGRISTGTGCTIRAAKVATRKLTDRFLSLPIVVL